MNITRYTDYSLRVLMYLGIHQGRLVTIKEIADSYGISKNHLMKVVQALNAKGYLLATRGKHGGLQLNAEPESINIGSLVKEIEQDLSIVECFSSPDRCVITPACQLKVIMGSALESFFDTLSEYTLADLLPLKERAKLSQLLAINNLT